jgi:hypothetical protein
VDVVGDADATAMVTVAGNATSRKGTYFAGTVTGSNYYYPRWADATVRETKGTSPNTTVTETAGRVFVPPPSASMGI